MVVASFCQELTQERSSEAPDHRAQRHRDQVDIGAGHDHVRHRHVRAGCTGPYPGPVDHYWATASEHHIRRVKVKVQHPVTGLEGLAKAGRCLDLVQPAVQVCQQAAIRPHQPGLPA